MALAQICLVPLSRTFSYTHSNVPVLLPARAGFSSLAALAATGAVYLLIGPWGYRRLFMVVGGLVTVGGLLLLPLGNGWMRPIALFPMANCLVVWIVLVFALRQPLRELSVAKYLHASRSIDDSTMNRAKELSVDMRPSYVLFLWPFLLIPLSWTVLVAVKP